MTVQFVNDLTGRTLTAGYTAGGTTLTISSAFISSAQTGDIYMRVDNEIFKCTAGANSTSLTVTGGIDGTTAADHAVGATVRIVAAAAHMQAFDADLAHLAGTETLTGAKTFSSATATDFSGAPIKVVDGSLTSPGMQFRSDTDNGFKRSATNTWQAVAGGVSVVQFVPTVISFLVGMTLSAGESHGRIAPSDDYTIAANTSPFLIEVGDTGLTFTFGQLTGAGANTRWYMILDRLGNVSAGSPLTLAPFDNLVDTADSINGGTAGASVSLTTTYGAWLVTSNNTSPGDWTTIPLGARGV